MDLIEINNIDELNNLIKNTQNKMIVIDFYATWCKPCMEFSEDFKQLSNIYNDILFLKINVDEIDDIMDIYEIEKLPTFIIIQDSDIIKKFEGASSLPEVKNFLNNNIKFELNDNF